MAKKKVTPTCDVCGKENTGTFHTVFTPHPEFKEIKGIRQCFKCLSESSMKHNHLNK